MKTLPLLLALLAMPHLLMAHLMYAWSYQELFDKADIVVIAKPTSTQDTKERTKFPQPGDVIPIIGVDTKCEIRVVLKGKKSLRSFVLHHYRLAEPDISVANGPPALLAFDTRKPSPYLMFLVRERDGRYAPASGQDDPALLSVFKLEGFTE
jgi:hypothetical protein